MIVSIDHKRLIKFGMIYIKIFYWYFKHKSLLGMEDD